MQLTANQVLQRHYLGFAEGFIMVYDTTKPESLDVLMFLKKDIDRNKDKKEVKYFFLHMQILSSIVCRQQKIIILNIFFYNYFFYHVI